MKCNWCGQGSGRKWMRDKHGKVFYYYCNNCVGQINTELIPPKIIKQLRDLWDFSLVPPLRPQEQINTIRFKIEELLKEWQKT